MKLAEANALYRKHFPSMWTRKQAYTANVNVRGLVATNHYAGYISALKLTGQLEVTP